MPAFTPPPTAIVIGVGAEAGLGAACCRRFAAAGHHVIAVGRRAERLQQVVDTIVARGGHAEARVADATSESAMAALFEEACEPTAARDRLNLVVFNAGSNQRIPLVELDIAVLRDFLEAGCVAGFITGREVARRMVPAGGGTLIFTGASASLRGRPGFAQFAAAKAGLRMLAQSMAREFGPRGLHVAHVVIDGGIDGQRLRERVPEFVAQVGEDGLLKLEAIAEAYWQLHCQPASAWSHEIDLRPFRESF
jgi:NAD(P)-dependent dehydrogenase (short-subunit alcohol dehydrogenase family)